MTSTDGANVSISTASADPGIPSLPSQWFLYTGNVDSDYMNLRSNSLTLGTAKINFSKVKNTEKFDVVYVVAKNGNKYLVDIAEQTIILIELNALNFNRSHADLISYLNAENNSYIHTDKSQSIKLNNVDFYRMDFFRRIFESINKNSGQHTEFRGELAEFNGTDKVEDVQSEYEIHFEPAKKRYLAIKKHLDMDSSFPALFEIGEDDFRALQ